MFFQKIQKKHASFFSRQKITTTKKQPTCLKERLLKFARVLCFGALNSDPLASKSFSENLREFCALEHSPQTHLPQTASRILCEFCALEHFVQTHLPQKLSTKGPRREARSVNNFPYNFPFSFPFQLSFWLSF